MVKIEWGIATKEDIHDDTDGIHVDCLVVACAAVDLGGHVGPTAHHFVEQAALVGSEGDEDGGRGEDCGE